MRRLKADDQASVVSVVSDIKPHAGQGPLPARWAALHMHRFAARSSGVRPLASS